MKTNLYLVGILLLCMRSAMAQPISDNTPAQNPVNPGRIPETSFPGLLISPDLRAAAMGDGGMALKGNGDASGLYLNPARMTDQANQSGISLTYTPWLRNLIDGQALMYVSYYRKINKREAIGFQLTYFDMGTTRLTDKMGYSIGEQHLGDFYLSGSYARQLSHTLSLAVSGQYIRSNLGNALAGYTTTNAFNTSISLYHHSKDTTAATQLNYGFSVNNIGGKISYAGSRALNFQPTNFRAGLAVNRHINSTGMHQVTVTFDVLKMLVTTPPVRNGIGQVVAGQDPATTTALGALLSSWGDSPTGLSEELKEIMWSLGAEYRYATVLAARAGYFHESSMKGGRRHLTLGLGFTVKNRLGIDGAYLIPVGQTTSPLAGTWRLGLNFTITKADKALQAVDDEVVTNKP